MRRWPLALVLALAASAIWVGAAFADASTYHRAYTATTRACAACHRAHTGLGNNLIKTTTTYGLCTSCHGTNSGLDVVSGAEWETDPVTHDRLPGVPPVAAAKGGGFVQALMNTDLAATKPTVPHTATATNPNDANDPLIVPNSAHRINGMPILGGTVNNPTQTTFTGPATVWGLGATDSGPGSSFTLECSTCHNPHGRGGPNGEATYRILRSDLGNKVSGAAATAYVPEDGYTSHDYAVDSPTWVYYGQSYSAPLPPPAGAVGTNVNLVAVSQWCAGCHTRVHATGIGSGSRDSGDNIYAFKHRTDGQSADWNYGTGVIDGGGVPACLTCHVAHGSNALMQRQAAEVPQPGTAEEGGSYLGSSLLRVDNRGVCELCHNK